ncbi:hypothetical protein GCM10007047_28330 [Cerasicoccus arenae]|uniref:Uncharacterized protein n=3 Tax=Cerasicoccus arenae TaxID=424488 RepID=A0A8J3GF82_9BACT|nr:hypothetical protein [Cerasicoccus arenae]GHC09438.1 hypothetical protein GCM10007047_28330 [Cerasicoccus arenae]
MFMAVMLASSLLAQSPEELVGQGVANVLPGYQFSKRLAGPTEDDHVLLFINGRDTALVTWTTGEPKTVDIPASPTNFTVFNTNGQPLSTLFVQNFNIGLVLVKEPAIYVPQGENAILQVAALAQTVAPKLSIRGPQVIDLDCEFVNPMQKPLILAIPGENSVAVKPGARHVVSKQVNVGRSFEPMRINVGASGIFQTVTIEMENPIIVDLRADLPGKLTVDILNPTADPFSGRMAMRLVGNTKPPFEFPVEMGPKETIKQMEIPLGIELPLPQPVQITITQPVGNPRQDVELTRTAAMQFMNVPGLRPGPDKAPVAWQLVTNGSAFADLRAGQPTQGAPWGDETIILAYQFEQPGSSLRVVPINLQSVPIAQMPASVGFWINGDRSGNRVSVRWKDATGKVFQPRARVIDWMGWRYETFATDPTMQAPLEWDSLLYVEGTKPSTGALMISGPVLTYQSNRVSQAGKQKSVEVKDDVSYGNPVKLDPSKLAPVTTPSR